MNNSELPLVSILFTHWEYGGPLMGLFECLDAPFVNA